MENLNSSRIKVKFMNPLLEIDIFGYSVEDTKRFFNTIIRIDKERNNIERKVTEEMKLTDSAGMSELGVLVDEGSPLPISSVVKPQKTTTFQVDAEGNPIPAVVSKEEERTPEAHIGEDTHGEGGLFEANTRHKPEEH